MRGKSYSNKKNSYKEDFQGGETKVMKKSLLSLLIFALIFTMAAPAFANTASEDLGEYADAVNVLKTLGIVHGYDDGTYRPLADLTRAQFAKIIVEATGNSRAAKWLEGSQVFEDLGGSHWASGYVAAAVNLGLFKGKTESTFGPNDNITQAEVVTVLLRALGYDDSLKGNWPYNYVIKADEVGIIADIDFNVYAAANRGVAAVFINNALDADLVVKNNDTGKFVGQDTSLFSNLGLDTKPGVVTASSLTEDGELQLDTGKVALASNAVYPQVASLLGYNVEYIVKNDKAVFVRVADNNKVVEGGLEAAATTKLVFGDDEEYTVTGDVYFYNGVKQDNLGLFVEGVVAKAFLNSDDEVRFVIGKGYDRKDLIVSETTETSRYQRVSVEGGFFYVNQDTVITLNGEAATFADIAEGQVAYVSLPGGTGSTAVYVDVVADTVTGKVTRVSAGKYTINGVVFGVSGTETAVADLQLGNTVTATLDINGKILKAVEVSEEEAQAATFSGYFLGSETYTTSVTENGRTKFVEVTDYKIATLDGEVGYQRVTADVYQTPNSLKTFTLEDGVIVADSTAPFVFSGTDTIKEDGVTRTSVTFSNDGKYSVNNKTTVWQVSENSDGETVVTPLAVSDLKAADEVSYVADGFTLTHIFLTAPGTVESDALDAVYGFLVSTSTEDVLEGEDVVTYTYATLNVDGKEVTYTVANNATGLDTTANTFVKLADVSENGVFDSASDASATSSNFGIVDGSVFSAYATSTFGVKDFVAVAGSTTVLVKTVDGDKVTFEEGSYFNFEDAVYDNELTTSEYTYNVFVVSSNSLYGGKEVADIIVIERTKN